MHPRRVTLPGASEHQVGLAIDIVCDTYQLLDEGFGNTDAGIWLSDIAVNMDLSCVILRAKNTSPVLNMNRGISGMSERMRQPLLWNRDCVLKSSGINICNMPVIAIGITAQYFFN